MARRIGSLGRGFSFLCVALVLAGGDWSPVAAGMLYYSQDDSIVRAGPDGSNAETIVTGLSFQASNRSLIRSMGPHNPISSAN